MADTNFDKVLAALVEPCAEEEKEQEQVDTSSEEETGLYNDDRYDEDDEDEYYDDEDDYDDDEDDYDDDESGYYLWYNDTISGLFNQIRDIMTNIKDDFDDYEYDEDTVSRIEGLLIDARDALESVESVTDNDWCDNH